MANEKMFFDRNSDFSKNANNGLGHGPRKILADAKDWITELQIKQDNNTIDINLKYLYELIYDGINPFLYICNILI